MNADRLFMLVDTCANIDEVKHEFPDLDFLTYFYAQFDALFQEMYRLTFFLHLQKRRHI